MFVWATHSQLPFLSSFSFFSSAFSARKWRYYISLTKYFMGSAVLEKNEIYIRARAGQTRIGLGLMLTWSLMLQTLILFLCPHFLSLCFSSAFPFPSSFSFTSRPLSFSLSFFRGKKMEKRLGFEETIFISEPSIRKPCVRKWNAIGRKEGILEI